MSTTILISGATRGIGRSIAEKFAEEGFEIVFCGRDAENVLSFSSHLSLKYGVRNLGIVCDVSVKSEVIEFSKKAMDFSTSISVLVNNAGVFLPGNIETEADGAIEKVLQTNLLSAYYLTRELLPVLKQNKRAHIFNMCSIASLHAYENGGSYSISKFALLGMSKVLRKECLPYNIGVTAVMPGATLTDSWVGAGHDDERFIRPSDVANVVWTAWEMNENAVMEEVIIRPNQGDL